MSEQANRVLLIGYGNPGRLDDGLGPALAEAVEKLALPGVTVDSDYQLIVEDGEAVSRHEVVIFADAAINGPEPFSFRRIEPMAEVSFTTHSVRPEAVLGLAHELFGSKAEGYILGIRGYDFDAFGEALSDKARANLAAATRFIEEVLRKGNYSDVAAKSCASSAATGTPSNEAVK